MMIAQTGTGALLVGPDRPRAGRRAGAFYPKKTFVPAARAQKL